MLETHIIDIGQAEPPQIAPEHPGLGEQALHQGEFAPGIRPLQNLRICQVEQDHSHYRKQEDTPAGDTQRGIGTARPPAAKNTHLHHHEQPGQQGTALLGQRGKHSQQQQPERCRYQFTCRSAPLYPLLAVAHKNPQAGDHKQCGQLGHTLHGVEYGGYMQGMQQPDRRCDERNQAADLAVAADLQGPQDPPEK